jgi:hypothetical protein
MLEHHSAQIADRRKSMLQLYASALFLFFMLHVAQSTKERRGRGLLFCPVCVMDWIGWRIAGHSSFARPWALRRSGGTCSVLPSPQGLRIVAFGAVFVRV